MPPSGGLSRGLMVALVGVVALWGICLAFGVTVSLVKAFPVVGVHNCR
jgi:hypothetical protein